MISVLGMRSPRGRRQQLDLLGQYQRPEMGREAFHKIRVGKDGGPVRAPVGIVVELPEVDQLINHARVGLEVANQLLIMAPFLQRRVPTLGLQFDRFSHRAHVQGGGPRHRLS